MKRAFTLDEQACAVLDAMAPSYPGGADALVNNALRKLTISESRLEEIASDPGFREMMRKSAADFRAGRGVPHRQAMAILRSRSRKNGKS